ncbi:hypothetical protein FUAX_41690 (plasmid) [Fulvitalea axinellae]|uniref:Outer membrane protein beta-barrel domain-containing protein n=1 Tax=Fulvitalea axinellae TaxID=1182444 RepID=A0AAU9D258_9BACT|nr:hypothetical protein FUAX_41690 [Fulvitalea axinellae]
MKKILPIILLVFGLGLSESFAQTSNVIFSAEYQTGFLVGDARDLVEKYSFRGFSISGEGFVDQNLAVGGEVGWTGFYQAFDRQTYHLRPGADLTADLSNYLYIFPINATFAYYAFDGDAPIRPFAKIGAGAYYIEKENDFGYYYQEDDDWRFGLQPEVGVIASFGTGLGVVLKSKYTVIFYDKSDIDVISYFNFNVGVTFTY